jgi:hypothetical protein
VSNISDTRTRDKHTFHAEKMPEGSVW